jgi:hypothetical protein
VVVAEARRVEQEQQQERGREQEVGWGGGSSRSSRSRPSFVFILGDECEGSVAAARPHAPSHAATLACATLTVIMLESVRVVFRSWGWGDVGAYGASGDIYLTGTQTRTPTLDALARNGTLLTDFHADHLCCPSRAALMVCTVRPSRVPSPESDIPGHVCSRGLADPAACCAWPSTLRPGASRVT